MNTLIDANPKSSLDTPRKAAIIIAGVYLALFIIGVLLPDNTPHAPAASTPSPAASAAAPGKVAKSSKTFVLPSPEMSMPRSLPLQLTAHHLYDSDYSLTWRSMGNAYRYHVYFANDRSMKDASLVLYHPVEGTLYRFTINGNAKKVWMAVAPIDGDNHEGKLSRPVNIGQAKNS